MKYSILLLILISQMVLAQSPRKWLEICEQKEKLGKIDTCIAMMTEALEVQQAPKLYYYPLLLKRGYLYMQNGKDKEAEADFDKAISMNVDSSQAYSAKGYLYLKTSHFFQSVSNFDKAIARGAKDISVFFCRAHALWDIKNYEVAMKEINHVLSLQNDHPDANYLKGRILARTLRFTEAIPYYNIALRLEPQSKLAEVYGYRGVAFLDLNELDKAEADLLKALQGGLQRDEITFAYTEVERRRLK